MPDANVFIGEQGPWDDPIAGWTDRSGWIYRLAPTFCFHCGERQSVDEEGIIFCWNDDPVPPDWDMMHWEAMIMTLGGMLHAGK